MKNLFKIIFLIYLNFCFLVTALPYCPKNETIGLCQRELNYDKAIKPLPKPCKIQFSLAIRDVFGIDDNRETVSMSANFGFRWLDPRLDYKINEIDISE